MLEKLAPFILNNYQILVVEEIPQTASQVETLVKNGNFKIFSQELSDSAGVKIHPRNISNPGMDSNYPYDEICQILLKRKGLHVNLSANLKAKNFPITIDNVEGHRKFFNTLENEDARPLRGAQLLTMTLEDALNAIAKRCEAKMYGESPLTPEEVTLIVNTQHLPGMVLNIDPTRIKIKDLAAAFISQELFFYNNINEKLCKNPTDLLKALAYTIDPENARMRKPVKIKQIRKYMTRGHRKLINQFLNNLPTHVLNNEFAKNKGLWLALFRLTHPFEKRYGTPSPAIDNLHNFPKKVKSQEGQIAALLSQNKNKKALELAFKNPGQLLRNLRKYVTHKNPQVSSTFMDMISNSDIQASVASGVSLNVLTSVFNLLNANNSSSMRVVKTKWGRAKRVSPAKKIADDTLNSLNDALTNIMKYKLFDPNGTAGKIHLYIDPTKRNNVAMGKDTSSTVFEHYLESEGITLTPGSKLPITSPHSVRILRFGIHWMESKSHQRCDIDLSMAFINDITNPREANFRYAGYMNSGGSATVSEFSGDLTSAPAPNGSTELYDIIIENIEERNQFIFPWITLYAGTPIPDLATAFFFVELLDTKARNKSYQPDPNNIILKIDLQQAKMTKGYCPCMLHIDPVTHKMELTAVDLKLPSSNRSIDFDDLEGVFAFMGANKTRLSEYDLLEMYAEVNALTVVTDVEEFEKIPEKSGIRELDIVM